MPIVRSLGVGVVLIVGLLGLRVALDVRALGRVDAAAVADAAATARDVAAMLDADLQRALTTVETVRDRTALPEINGLPPQTRRALLFDRLAAHFGVGSTLVVDAKGRIEVDSQSLSPRPADLSNQIYFTIHRDHHVGLHIAVVRDDPVENVSVLAMSVGREAADGTFAGVVVAMLQISHFCAQLANQDTGADGNVRLLDRTGQVLADRSPDCGVPKQPLRNWTVFRQAAAAAPSSVVTLREPDPGPLGEPTGTPRLHAAVSVGDSPLIVVVTPGARPEAETSDDPLSGTVVATLVLGVLGAMIAVFLRELARRREAERVLENTNRVLSELATTDGLTGLANRRTFDQLAAREWAQALRDGTSISVLMIDADRFKTYNDTYGHIRGDDVLRAIAEAIRGSVRRPHDIAARYGGEEFAVVLPDTDQEGTRSVADLIHGLLAHRAIEHKGSETGRVTLSIGASLTVPVHGQTFDELLFAADSALYVAKREGRNRTVFTFSLPMGDGPPIEHGTRLH